MLFMILCDIYFRSFVPFKIPPRLKRAFKSTARLLNFDEKKGKKKYYIHCHKLFIQNAYCYLFLPYFTSIVITYPYSIPRSPRARRPFLLIQIS